MAARSADGRTYTYHAFFSFFHPLLLVGMLMFAMFVPTRWDAAEVFACIMAALVGDVLLVLAVSGIPAYRRTVDAAVAEAARQAAQATRARLLEDMSADHRHELQQLESLVDGMGRSPAGSSAAVQQMTGACGDLLAAFVSLSIQHRRSLTCLVSVDRAKLGKEIAMLEQAIAAGAGPVEALLRHRLALVQERADVWDVASVRIRAIEEQLAVIAERIRLGYEQTQAPPRGDWEPLPLRVAVPDDQELEEAQEEAQAEEEVDARMLALGRPPR